MQNLKHILSWIFLFIGIFHNQLFSQNFIDKYLSDPLIYTTVASSADNINKPRDLDFKPNSNELWVVNYGTSQGGDMVIIYNAGFGNQSSQYRKDSHTSHFMMYPSAVAFSDIGELATTGEIKNTASASSTFMGPTLWSGDTNITAKIFQNNWVNGYPLGSHLDMLHQSPFAMGIAHDSAKAYWVFDGYNSNICKYDFSADHSPGYDNHSAGKIWRYTDVNVLRAPGVPSHMVLDKSTKWLYIVDGGNKRLLRINTSTGNIIGNLNVPSTSNEPLTLYKQVTGITQQVIDTYTSQPSGIDYSNNRLIVSDYLTGNIRIYDVSVSTPSLMGTISTGQPGIMGVKVGYDGKIWFVNNTLNTIVRIDPSPVTIDATILEIISPTLENSESKFYSPAFNSCSGSISPQIKFGNNGSTNLNSALISYRVDGGSVVTYSWSGLLSPGSNVTITLPVTSVFSGAHKIKVYCSAPNGLNDLNTLNDAKEGSFRSLSTPMGLPFSEDFSTSVFPPANWSYIGYNKYCKMSKNSSVGAYGVGIGALQMDNYTGPMNITGQNDYFLSPRINFSSASEITYLTFDVAYAQRSTLSTDQLDVSVSTDCGTNWKSLYNKAGSVLSTTDAVGTYYSPNPDEWRTDSINLAAYKGQPEVMFMFTTNSNWGNNLYLDNINISSVSTAGLKKIGATRIISIYPNPSSGQISIHGIEYRQIKSLTVFNSMGARLPLDIVKESQSAIELDLTGQPNGAYFVSIVSLDGASFNKVITLAK